MPPEAPELARREKGGGLLAVFDSPHDAARAIASLRQRGCDDVRAAMPAPYPEVERALGRSPSRIGWITFAGGLAGACFGYLFTSWTSVDWPLNIGGRPLVSLVPYTVIGFECMILFGALTNLTAVLIGAFWSRWRRGLPDRAEFAGNRIGVFVPAAQAGDAPCEALCREAGAVEVSHVA